MAFMLTQEMIVSEVERYEPMERLHVVDSILQGMMRPDPEIEQAWHEEAVRRWERYKREETSTVAYHEVMAKYRKQG
jgi:hypothetical protein